MPVSLFATGGHYEYREEIIAVQVPYDIDTPDGSGNTSNTGGAGDTWFDDMLRNTRGRRDGMIGGLRDDIPWSPPVPPPKDRPPTDPIDKDPGPDIYIPDHLPSDAPCQGCGPVTLFPPDDPRGGYIKYTSKYGTGYEDLRIRKNGKWIDNPMLAKLGINVNGNQCDCENTIGPDDFDPPDPNDPDYDPDCEESVKKMLQNFPEISGCNEATKKMIANGLFNACRQIGKRANDGTVFRASEISNRSEEASLSKIFDCMSDPEILKSINKIDCTNLPLGRAMQTFGSEGKIQIDMTQTSVEASRLGVPLAKVMSSFLLHELTHICTERVWGIPTEAENWILSLLLIGDDPTTFISKEFMETILCADPAVKLFKKIMDVPNYKIVTGSFEIDLRDGRVYALPRLGGDAALLTLPNAPYANC